MQSPPRLAMFPFTFELRPGDFPVAAVDVFRPPSRLVDKFTGTASWRTRQDFVEVSGFPREGWWEGRWEKAPYSV
jgi:hypothetical protein